MLACEEEPGLGNGGAGPAGGLLSGLAGHPGAPGDRLRHPHEFGIFDQDIRDGWQVEKTDYWLADPIPGDRQDRPRLHRRLGRAHRAHTDEHGHERVRWVPERSVGVTTAPDPGLG